MQNFTEIEHHNMILYSLFQKQCISVLIFSDINDASHTEVPGNIQRFFRSSDLQKLHIFSRTSDQIEHLYSQVEPKSYFKITIDTPYLGLTDQLSYVNCQHW